MVFDLKPVLADWLRSKGNAVNSVLSYEEKMMTGGYCETCWYEDWNVVISYADNIGETRQYVYYGTFGQLVTELTEDDLE